MARSLLLSAGLPFDGEGNPIDALFQSCGHPRWDRDVNMSCLFDCHVKTYMTYSAGGVVFAYLLKQVGADEAEG